MTRGKTKRSLQEIKELIAGEEDILRPLIGAVLQEVLEAEMSQALGAEKGERIEGRLGYRSGYYVLQSDHQGGKSGTTGTPRSPGAVLERTLRALPTQ
jgi:transposase-like protein